METKENPNTVKHIIGLKNHNTLTIEIAKLILGKAAADRQKLHDWLATSWDDYRKVFESPEYKPRIIELLARNPDEVNWQDPQLRELIETLAPIIAENAEQTKITDETRDPNMFH